MTRKMKEAFRAVTLFHAVFMLSIIGPQLWVSWVTRGSLVALIPSGIISAWLFVPCNDCAFGNRGKHYWLRQSCFSVGTLITAALALL